MVSLYLTIKLIGQKFEWTIASTEANAIRLVIMNHHCSFMSFQNVKEYYNERVCLFCMCTLCYLWEKGFISTRKHYSHACFHSHLKRKTNGFNLINAVVCINDTSDLFARISSRFTTVIRVKLVCQINYNWFNEPSAVSLLNSFILRLAWLNLWDKHMTTGRINQVIIVW